MEEKRIHGTAILNCRRNWYHFLSAGLVQNQYTNCDVFGGTNDDTLGSQFYACECCYWVVGRDLKVFPSLYGILLQNDSKLMLAWQGCVILFFLIRLN